MATTPGFTHTVGKSYKNDAGTIATTTASYTGNRENDLSVSVPASTTNQPYVFATTLSKWQSCVIYAKGALTLKTNSSSAPTDTLSLVANQALIWDTDLGSAGQAKPFTGDVTQIFLTNAATSAVSLDIRILENV